jgi:hypothetical protein
MRDQARVMSRSLYEGNLQFLIEAEGDDAELEKLMPKAVAATLKTFTDLAGIAALKNAQELTRLLNAVKGKIAKHTTSPETPEALKDFKTAEELHATIVKIIDRYTASLVAKEKSGGNPNQRAGILRDIINKSVAEATSQITQQISGNSILKKAFSAITKSGDLEKRVNELTNMNLQDALNSISNLSYDDVKKAVLDPKFKEQRDVQGKVVSTPPKELPPGDSSQESSVQFDDKQKKLIDQVSKRVDDFKRLFQSNIDDGKISREAGSIMMKVLSKFEDDPEKTYQGLSDLGPKGKNNLNLLIQQAEEKFETLDSELESLDSDDQVKKGSSPREGVKKQASEISSRMKDIRQAVDYRVKNKDITEKEGDTLQALLDKVEGFGDDSEKLGNWYANLSTKASELFDNQVLNDANEGWTELDTNLKAIKKSAPKLDIDFGVPLDELEEIVRDFSEKSKSGETSMTELESSFKRKMLDSGSSPDKYETAIKNLTKLGVMMDDPKALKAMGLENLSRELGGDSGPEGGAPEAAGRSLSSILFNNDSSIKKKLDPGGEKIKTSLTDLNSALASYTSGKGGKKNKAALVAAIKGTQDSLKDVKLEGTKSHENLIVERWQRLAGLL